MIKQGLYYSDLSKGSFDITIGSISSLWDFKKHTLPEDPLIQHHLHDVSYKNIILGGNILCVGKKQENPFIIGVTNPQQTSDSLFSLKINDLSVVTSGTYQRFFEIDSKRYHHILNPKTGYSYENGLSSVTIISKKSIQGDALSTVCFSLGKEKGLELLNSLEGVSGCFIDENNQVSYSKAFKHYLNKG